jgi:hypothetical protein
MCAYISQKIGNIYAYSHLRLRVLYFISQNPFLFAHNTRIILTASIYSTDNMFVFSHFYGFHLNHPRTLNIPPR